ncbi:MAG: nicotinate (nicotinamide) nucleotide adenylyltransferase [Clostridia bacterium]
MATLIFGGAFDPPHCEHINLVKAAIKQLDIDKVVVVPTFLPPHKGEGFLSFEDRCQLIKLAFCDINAEICIDNIEVEEQNDNYTYRILPKLKEKYGDIIFLLGGDSLEYFSSWKNPQEIVKCCPIAVAGRSGYNKIADVADNLKAQFGGEFILIDYVGKDVSSAIIKAKLLMNIDVCELPKAVADYINQNALFCDYKDKVKKLRCIQSPALFEHSVSVVLSAVDLNSKHNLKQDFRKVFLAALLHDNAKERLSLDGISVPADSIESPVLHQFLGAEKAKRDFNIDDIEILDAIRYHTTAKADMTMLQKLIYTADSLSADRTYDPIPQLRKIATVDFERGFKSVLRYTYLKVTAKGKGIYPLTEAAKCFYLDKNSI